MLTIKSNMPAWNAGRHLNLNQKRNAKIAEKLSSGYRINRSADDAAGLSISEKMRRQIRGLTQASANAQDGISMVQSAEGAMNEIHDMLQRANELAVKAANGTLSDNDREMVDAEIQQIKAEIDKIADHTVFNEKNLFPTNGYSPRSASVLATYQYDMELNLKDGTVTINGSPNNAAVNARAGVKINSGSALADKIANTLVPDAIGHIFAAFPALETAQGGDTIKMSLNVSFIDGPGNTLAYASYSYRSSGGRPITMGIKVDAADFSNADADGTGKNAEVLESTIAHELMHTVMQYNLTDGMSGRKGEKYPTWFVEGTAQLAGGGFTTGWNNSLLYYARQLTSENDASQDAGISGYLKKYTMAGRPYGHGYLGAAYIGWLANGKGDVNATNIAAGMNKVFADLAKGANLDNTIKKYTGLTESDINARFRSGNAELTEFVRKLAYESKDGAGSVISGDLSAGGAGSPILSAGGPSSNLFYIDPGQVNVDFSGGAKVGIQVGAEAGQHIEFELYQMNAEALGLTDMNVRTVDSASDTINSVKNALVYVSNVRSYYGAIQNRLEHTIANLDNVVENTTAAESRIRDTDIAKEMVDYANDQILLQAGQSMLAQANHNSDYILSLLG